jgi:hypothetical protein
MTPLIFLIALASGMPTATPENICRSTLSTEVSTDPKLAFSACVKDELTARAQMKKDWNRYSADARANCSQSGAFSVSYVEMLTCLEMQSGANFRATMMPAAEEPTPAVPPAAPKAAAKKP